MKQIIILKQLRKAQLPRPVLSRLLTTITIRLYKCNILPSTVEDWTRVLYNLDDPAAIYRFALLSLPVLSLSAFIYKVGPGSHKQSNAEHTRSPAVVVASSLAVANGSASVEIDAHGVEKAKDG